MTDEGQTPPPDDSVPPAHSSASEEPTHGGDGPTLGDGLRSPSAPSEPTGAINAAEAAPGWKGQLQSLLGKAKQAGWVKNLGQKLQEFEPAQTAEWASRTFQRQDTGAYGKAVAIGLCSFFLADLAALVVGKYIPEPPITHLGRGGFKAPKSIGDYGIVFTRNLFSSKGIIPGEDNGAGGANAPGMDLGGPPTKTTLPFNLIGTVLLQDAALSLATIEDKSASTVFPVRVDDEIPNKARILKIEPRRVTFLNLGTQHREYVELPEENGSNPHVNLGGPAKTGAPGIENVAGNQYNINRSEVDKALSDLNKVLTEARAVPNFENGAPAGYKLFQIVPNSIYDKLGLQNGDVITGLNGEGINDPGKAFQMLSELKTSNHLELQVKKDGRVQNYIYDIR